MMKTNELQFREFSSQGTLVRTPGGVLLISPGLDSGKGLDGWREALGGFTAPLSVVLIISTELEWDEVDKQEYLFNRDKSGEFLPICSPLHPLISVEPIPWRSYHERLRINQIPKLYNAKSYLSMCRIYQRDLTEFLRTTPPDAAELYTLIKWIKHFEHEVHSQFLKQTQKREGEIQSEIWESSESELQLTRELISCKVDMLRQLRAHAEVLKGILELIPVVIDPFPSLEPLHVNGRILLLLLEEQLKEERASFIKEQILLQLWNSSYGLISVVTSPGRDGRAKAGFALRLAVMQLHQEFSAEDLYRVADEWPKGSPALMSKLRALFWEYLIPFFDPGAEVDPAAKLQEPFLLELLPKETEEHGKLIEKKGDELQLTDQGSELLKQIVG